MGIMVYSLLLVMQDLYHPEPSSTLKSNRGRDELEIELSPKVPKGLTHQVLGFMG